MRALKGFCLTLAGLLALTGCAMGEISSSGVSTPEDEVAAYSAQKNGSAEALDELGWSPSRALTADEEEILNKRIELKHLETHLTDMRERDQYFKYKSYEYWIKWIPKAIQPI